jgi:YfiH family protein
VAEPPFLEADWPAPPGVRAVVTLRRGGMSTGRYASFNLGDHVGDDAGAVRANRLRLVAALGLPAEPLWLEQVHGTDVARFGAAARPRADASVALEPGQVCAVLVADCLPVLLADREGTCVAAAHCGWRGLAAGVIERTAGSLPVAPDRLIAWLGPAIGPDAFEVGPEVRAAFVSADPAAAADFRAGAGDRWLADLYALARRRLSAAGIGAVYGGGACTVSDASRFFSYRRDGITGRMAALVWRE